MARQQANKLVLLSMQQINPKLQQHLLFLSVSLVYFIISLVYVHHLPLVMDEFQQAWSAVRATELTPYADYQPYKTLLGYYLLALPLHLFKDDTWQALIHTKEMLVCINASFIYLSMLMLRSRFSDKAIILAAVFFILANTTLVRSASIRVDMLTAWCGVFGLLFFLNNKNFISAILIGSSFLFSQKGVYYCVAMTLAIMISTWRYQGFKLALISSTRYGLVVLIPILSYLAVFAALSSPEQVINTIFFKAAGIASNTSYFLHGYWLHLGARNPGFILLAIAGLFSLNQTIKKGPEICSEKDYFLFFFSIIILLLCLSHKQPFPYFFVLITPFIWIVLTWHLDKNYFDDEQGLSTKNKIILSTAMAGSLFFFVWLSDVVLDRKPEIQRGNVQLLDLLSDEESYLGGLNYLPFRDQGANPKLDWIDRVKNEHFATLPAKEVIGWIENPPPTIVVSSYRTRLLPPAVNDYVFGNYAHLCKNLYSRQINALEEPLSLRIESDSQYQVTEVKEGASINSMPTLKASIHHFEQGQTLELNGLKIQNIPVNFDLSKIGDCEEHYLFLNYYAL